MSPTFKMRIERDEMAEDPREVYDNLGKMVCFHKRYTLGDPTDLAADAFKGWNAMRKYLVRKEGAEVILPLYLMDHSGLAMSTSPFACRWDSGQVGWIYVTQKDLKVAYGAGWADATQRVEEALKSEVDTYDKFLSGDVWGYSIVDETGEEVESCWGFYGENDAQEQGAAALAAIEMRCCKGANI